MMQQAPTRCFDPELHQEPHVYRMLEASVPPGVPASVPLRAPAAPAGVASLPAFLLLPGRGGRPHAGGERTAELAASPLCCTCVAVDTGQITLPSHTGCQQCKH